MTSKLTFKHVLIHIGLIILVFLVLSYLFFYVYLPKSTNHGKSVDVPDFKGFTLDEVAKITTENNLRYKIFDSTFTTGYPPLSVITQFPAAGEKVKQNRTIYVSISSVNPPLVKMPKLVSNSLKAAEMTLKSYGLLVGQVQYMANPNEGAVLRQTMNGVSAEPGTPIKKGSSIDLLVSSGLSDTEIPTPELVGLKMDEVKTLLSTQGLGVGSVVYEENSDEEPGMVIRQKPGSKDRPNIRLGEVIDVWVAGEKP